MGIQDKTEYWNNGSRIERLKLTNYMETNMVEGAFKAVKNDG